MRIRHLFAAWEDVRRRVAVAQRAVLFFDFDGTLAPIRSRPTAARLPNKTRRLLRKVVAEGTPVAIVSGRALEDVFERAALRGIWYSGTHGYALRTPKSKRILLATRAERSQIRRLRKELAAKLGGLQGIEMEQKCVAVPVHYRGAHAKERRSAFAAVKDVLSKTAGMRLLEGKKVWEILPKGQIDKWTAVQFILRRQRKMSAKPLVFYFGDDMTDEAVFRKMKGISVAVGKQQNTAARFYVRSPAEVAQFLEKWLQQSKKGSKAD